MMFMLTFAVQLDDGDDDADDDDDARRVSLQARYVRLRPLAFYSANSNWGMRAGLVVGKSAGSNNMFVGRHHFRRCIVTDGYTRLVRVGEYADTHAHARAHTRIYTYS